MRLSKRDERRCLAGFAACALAWTFAFACEAAESAQTNGSGDRFSIRWISVPRDAVEVTGIAAAALEKLETEEAASARWSRLLSVYAGQGDLASDLMAPPMLGVYRAVEGRLRFEPGFPLEPGLSYKAVFRPGELPGWDGKQGSIVSSSFKAPNRRASAATVVANVYPSAGVLPENLLKFYIHFSAPMSRGGIYQHIHLKDESGQDVELPFLELDEELWDPAMTRLTLFIDPGRIKRGVLPLEEVGPALEQGRRYTLLIDSAWRDANGAPLAASFRKSFKVGPPDRESPDPSLWKAHAPEAGTRDALSLIFPDPMDNALARRMIRVLDGAGNPLSGEIALEKEETHWKFIPAQPWPPGSYKLRVTSTIEDLAGNNVGKVFDVDLEQSSRPSIEKDTVELPFVIR